MRGVRGEGLYIGPGKGNTRLGTDPYRCYANCYTQSNTRMTIKLLGNVNSCVTWLLFSIVFPRHTFLWITILLCIFFFSHQIVPFINFIERLLFFSNVHLRLRVWVSFSALLFMTIILLVYWRFVMTLYFIHFSHNTISCYWGKQVFFVFLHFPPPPPARDGRSVKQYVLHTT